MTIKTKSTAEIDPLLTISDAAAILKLHPVTVERLIRQGDLPAVKVGGSIRLQRRALDAHLAANAVKPKKKKRGAK